MIRFAVGPVPIETRGESRLSHSKCLELLSAATSAFTSVLANMPRPCGGGYRDAEAVSSDGEGVSDNLNIPISVEMSPTAIWEFVNWHFLRVSI